MCEPTHGWVFVLLVVSTATVYEKEGRHEPLWASISAVQPNYGAADAGVLAAAGDGNAPGSSRREEQEERERQGRSYVPSSPPPRPLTLWQKLKEFDRKCDEWLGFK